MWKVLAIIFTVVFVCVPFITEIAGNIAHKRAMENTEIGGTQGINILGTLVAYIIGLLAVVCWGFWYLS